VTNCNEQVNHTLQCGETDDSGKVIENANPYCQELTLDIITGQVRNQPWYIVQCTLKSVEWIRYCIQALLMLGIKESHEAHLSKKNI